MCGIAGIIDVAGTRRVPHRVLQAMAAAIVHRGPDEDGFFEAAGIGLASRRLSIVGLTDGRQPITNEDDSIHVVFNGEFFDYRERRSMLESSGHRFKTHCDTELIPHLWEDHAEQMFGQLRGQFAFALWDDRCRKLILARDRFGICPLYWTRQDDWLLFASEIKALLHSGMVEAAVDPRGINHVFTFFALPGPVTCFQGIQLLLPGRYLAVQPHASGAIKDSTYWEMNFPDQGNEERGSNGKSLSNEFETVLKDAVKRRLRADVPVVSYLSGGVDSSMVVALANQIRQESIPTFTVRIIDPSFDESAESLLVARSVGSDPVVVNCGRAEILDAYPDVIRAAEGPVIDTACAALLLLAREVHARDFKVALTGEGADEWLAGYPWYRLHRLLSFLDVIPGLKLSQLARRTFLRLSGAPRFPWSLTRRLHEITGGHNAWLDVYGLMSMAKLRFYSQHMWAQLHDHVPYADLGLNLDRIRRWHPLNRSLYFGARIMLPGLLLAAKGDRVAMNSSVETRYPFLDEKVFEFCAKLHPRWKLHGLRDKYLLRLLADRWLPRTIAWRRKAMFRAPFDSFLSSSTPTFVDQLLTDDSLRRTNYFEPSAVHYWQSNFQKLSPKSSQRVSIEMGLVGVIATQLWHHIYIDGSLADLPSLATQRGGYVAGR